MKEPKKNIIIKLENQGVFYNEKQHIPWSATNFPGKDKFSFKEHYNIYWEVQLISFDKETGKLTVKPTEYFKEEVDHFSDQKPKFHIKSIEFKALSWQGLEMHLSYYTPLAFDGIVDKALVASYKKEKDDIHMQDFVEDEWTDDYERQAYSFKYPLKKVIFKLGYAEISKRFKGLLLPVTIRIDNPNLVPEFNYVKPYFAKIFGKRTIDIKGEIIVKSQEEVVAKFKSDSISTIDEDLIANVKRLMIKQSLKTPQIKTIDKSLFTNEDFLSGFHEEELGNTISLSEKELIKELFSLEGIRNRRELEYLSGKLHDKNEKLRFTLNPDFGFVFFVDGQRMYHFIWELLNTHATSVVSGYKSKIFSWL